MEKLHFRECGRAGSTVDFIARALHGSSEGLSREGSALSNIIGQLIAHVPAAVAMFDRDLRVLAYSRRFAEYTQSVDRIAPGRWLFDVLPMIPESRRSRYMRCLEGEVVCEEEEVVPQGSSSRREWVRCELHPCYDAEEKVGGILAFIEPVTTAPRSQPEIVARQQRLAALLASIDGVSIGLDDEGRIDAVVIPPGTQSLLTKEQLIGRRYDEILPSEVSAQVVAALAALKRGRRPNLIRYPMLRSEELIWWSAKIARRRESGGREDGYTVVTSNITENHREIEARRHSEAELRTIFEASPMGVSLVDSSTGRFVRVNPALSLITGYPVEDLVGREVNELTEPKHRELTLQLFRALSTRARKEYLIEKPYRRPDGSVVWVRERGVAISSEEQDAPLLVTIAEDISAQRQANALVQLQTAALQAADNAIVITDSQGRVEWANAAFVHLTGLGPGVHNGLRLLDLGAPGDASSAAMWEALCTGQAWHGECVCLRADGTPYDEEMTLTPVRQMPGVIGHFIAIKQDVSARKRAQAEADAMRERYRLALDAAKLGTFYHDVNANTMSLDAQARAHLGVDKEVITFEEAAQCFDPSARDQLADVIARAAEEGSLVKIPSVEHRVLGFPDGDHYVVIDMVLHFEREGSTNRLVEAVGTICDVTATHRAAEALRASEERYRTLVDNLDDIVFSEDRQSTLTFVSRSIERFGFSSQWLVGRRLAELAHPDDRKTAMLRTTDPQAAREEKMFRMFDAAGKVRYVALRARPLFQQGQLVGSIGILSDRTTQHQIEQQLRVSQRMEAVGLLAGGVAHDFNNILTIIQAYTDLTKDQLLPDSPIRANIDEIETAARSAADLTQQLLAFSRKQMLHPEPVALNELVNDLAKMLRRLIGEDIELIVASDGGSLMVMADKAQLEQVILNLVVNARDAMPIGGRMTITTSRVSLDAARAAKLQLASGSYVVLAIGDTGHGIEAAILPHVFEPFFTTKKAGLGTGLGLATVYGIVTQSGGAIDITTSVGEGSTFSIYLPCSSLPRTRGRGAAPNIARGSGKLLLVEDEPALRRAAAQMLESIGYSVLAAANAEEAIALAMAHRDSIRVMVTDMVMPGMTGRKLAEHLWQHLPELPVLFTSGYTQEVIESNADGSTNFLAKPYRLSELAEKLRALLQE